jgi:aldehyde dehydrogenase (NAD+)
VALAGREEVSAAVDAAREEVSAAVDAARAAFPQWRAVAGDRRRLLMLAGAAAVRVHAEELAHLAVIENSTPTVMTRCLADLVASRFEYYAGFADKRGGTVVPSWPAPAFDYTLDEPYDVIAIITPRNSL